MSQYGGEPEVTVPALAGAPQDERGLRVDAMLRALERMATSEAQGVEVPVAQGGLIGNLGGCSTWTQTAPLPPRTAAFASHRARWNGLVALRSAGFACWRTPLGRMTVGS